MIKPISNVTLKPLPPDKNGNIFFHIEIDGIHHNISVSGAFLEAAFSYQDKYILIFVTLEGGCFEELLHIYLLDPYRDKVIDYAIIGNLYGYAYGDVSSIQIRADNTIFFKFITADGWLLTLFKQPAKIFPISFKALFVVQRPFAFKRYFSITEIKT
ncbi:hypothetical protein BGI30_07190 [Snodgrassella alvi]|jgi:hypothetical protein|uniref:hypothetical protein n=1 Tax=Snodgrassella alvi TaxID=1196083 RepID=UPI000C1ECF10|nr:hypothetical protein [Snodgrassella alvi]PIT10033.1 hypothetical protein BGI30_07190 [Snodgrassella alvi]PIT57301.1 hypothetical protein BHC59_05240 [Snodgrassella alvi]